MTDPAPPADPADVLAGASDDDIEARATGFEDVEEKTSPEVIRHQRRGATAPARDANPIAVVAVLDAKVRRRLVDLLWSDGWNAIDAKDADELFEICRVVAPHVALVDASIRTAEGEPMPEALRAHRRDLLAMRTVALLDDGGTLGIAGALADGYDDFISDANNDAEVLVRTATNLRDARALSELQKQRRDAAMLLELSQTLASSLDMQLILHTVSRLIAEVIELERCSIVLVDPDHDDAVMVAASEDRAVRDLRIRLSNYPELKRCVETAMPVIIDDAAIDPLLVSVRSSVVERGVRAMALFPIVFEERVTGVLFLRSNKLMRAITDREIQVGQTVAAACAVAIRNARLFDLFRDQTERINSMALMAERQMEALRKYEDFFEYAADGMAIIDVDARILYVNREGRRVIGRERDELLTLTLLDLLAEESRSMWPEVVDQVRLGRFKRSFDVYVRRKDGTERVFSLSAGGVGQGTGLLILSFRDVTETREMEIELRTTKDFLENLIDNSVDAIVAADMNGKIMLFNKGAERICGYKAEHVIGRMHIGQLYPSGVATDVMHRLRDEKYGGKGRLEPQRREIMTAQGDIVPVSMTASIIYEDGEEVATVGVFTDLRDRLTIERRLSEAQDQLMKTEKARVAAELAGMAAHELNQPLTSVLGYAEMLKNRIADGDARLRRPIETIFKQAERMAEIVRKIGRITKYETKPYGAHTMMMDLERASSPEPADDTGSHRVAPRFDDAPSLEGGEPIASPGPSFMAALASMQAGRSEATDPRAAVIRLDTIEEPKGYRDRVEQSMASSTAPARSNDGNTSLVSPASVDPTVAPLPRSLSVGIDFGALGESDEHTSPGVRVPDLARRGGSKTEP